MPKAYPCNCKSYNCRGKLVDYDTRRTHERADLRQRTSASQGIHRGLIIPHLSSKPPSLVSPYPTRGPILPPIMNFPDPPASSPSAVEQQMIDHSTLTQEDIDIQVFGSELPNLGPNFHSPEALLDAVDYYSTYNAVTVAGAQPLTLYHAHHLPPDPEGHALRRATDKALEEIQRVQQELADDPVWDPNASADVDDEIPDVDFDVEENADFPDAANPQEQSEDNPDPFQVNDDSSRAHFTDLSTQPSYLVVIYMMTTWLHLQWHLPRAACNAVLNILSCLVLALCPSLLPPFVTLPSAMKVLGLDLRTLELPCCPSCREVYPPAGSLHTQDECIPCKAPLFLPDQTKRGLLRSKKIPHVKYPYLPLSEQIQSLLSIPGVEDPLDDWRAHPHSPRDYTDIFDGEICRTKLKALDGTLFFANGPQDHHGPNGELRIGVNLGIDW
ncbi:hypothetical protein M404DRAFT_154084 [Pisolithus tinctorius Marx 270]|uniref:Post-SET domain-containing protein n=1 Tax=Pisolithus tinctorius Marx 270 TaxID=870435 RepID=A0A0C3NX07_PISTI|nr:hypothetical protein M404DRAFT_154084 [Pisolithus tinctorius Marx 270]